MSNVPNQVSAIIAKLREPAFIDALRKYSEEWERNVQDVYAGDVEGNEDSEGDWSESVFQASLLASEPEELLKLITSLEQPRVITQEEFDELFLSYAERWMRSGFEEGYGHFLDYLEHHLIQQRESNQLFVCDLSGVPSGDDHFNDGFKIALGKLMGEAEALGKRVDPVEVRGLIERAKASRQPETDQRIELRLPYGIEVLPVFVDNERYGTSLYIQLRWNCSPKAFEQVVAEIGPAIKSAIHSVRILAGARGQELSFPHLRDGLPFIRFCLASLWIRKDPLDKRLANAIRLIREADNQAEDAIGLALSISAIEALVGRHGGQASLSETLATNVAAITEPSLEQRNSAIDYFKKLYEMRSKALHGVTLEGSAELRGEARLLAAAVLRAIWEHRTLPSGVTDDKGFFNMLRDRNRREGLPDGVLDSPARSLWAKSDKSV